MARTWRPGATHGALEAVDARASIGAPARALEAGANAAGPAVQSSQVAAQAPTA